MNRREQEDEGIFEYTGLVEIRTSENGGILVPPDAVEWVLAAMEEMAGC